ncbi:hypothetical protein B9W64_32195 [Streptomyces sp. CS159]|uniref:DUF5682 family protein n=1 Tax=Streptomyces sp. CS159 TaxID=1982762 RepID=UPI000B41A721|nr:DUF5682 family protein [Streptomyces sp. CS159]OWA02738.1 hypothetical protein B9W64_32195 [Streptomyces sp. CS159]
MSDAGVTFLGVRHHSPACAGLVRRTIRAHRPAYVLVEGPADMNDRIGELLLGHELPIAVFSHHRGTERVSTSWAPLCAYSPEWVALTEGRAAGAEVRFIDLPAWHHAFTDRPDGAANRYADAEARYSRATERLRARYRVDTVDALWDRLFEIADPDGLRDRLDAYFALVRGDTEADDGDRAREQYMASWVRAAVAHAGNRPVLVVTGGFHQPALRALATAPGTTPGAEPAAWPPVPAPPDGAVGGSFLVPYSFRQMDAFAGYQSGMPSPRYYQRLWDEGPEAAARTLRRTVVERLRARHLPASTAALISAHTLTEGLAALRGHPHPACVDVLDGLAAALITDDLDQPLPWNTDGPLRPGAHPAVVETVAACTGERTGRLHPDTPLPPLVHHVTADEICLGLDGDRTLDLDLTNPRGLERSRFLHQLRILGIPGHTRVTGPDHGADPRDHETWEPRPRTGRDAALTEAGAYGARPDEAAAALLTRRLRDTGTAADAGTTAALLFDAVLCGAGTLSRDLLDGLAHRIRTTADPGPLGRALAVVLGLWRHDRVFGTARDPLLGTVLDHAVDRLFHLVEGLHGGPPGVDVPRLRALTAARDALLHAAPALALTPETAAATAARIARDRHAPADLRGAALGLRRALGAPAEPAGEAEAFAAAADPAVLGDWLAGLLTLAREEVLRPAPKGEQSLLDTLDGVVTTMTDDVFLHALPALRQAFAFFPPRERERVAHLLLDRRNLHGSARTLLRTSADPLLLARAAALEEHTDLLLDRHALGAPR